MADRSVFYTDGAILVWMSWTSVAVESVLILDDHR
jgi:hypothetical protein